MKILVTGANGYLGQGVVKKLLDRGCEVIATDISIEHIDKRAKLVKSNIFEVMHPYDFFMQPDVLLHLAWRDGFFHYSDAHINDLPKHYDFIKKLIQDGVKQIAVMGSMHEVGFFEGCIYEDTPCYPLTPYGISKNALRSLTENICKKNNVIFQWLRGFYIVGNSKVGNSIFSKIVNMVEDGKKELPFTTGQNQCDFIDYDDFCNRVAVAVCQTNENGIINICSGKPEKLGDVVERFIKENGYEMKLLYGKFMERDYDSKAVWGDSTKIESILCSSYIKESE